MDAEGQVKRLTKSRADRMIDGVCGGIAEFIGIDATLVRIAFVMLIFAGGIGLALYVVGMILIPAGSAPLIQPGAQPPPATPSVSFPRMAGIAFVILGGILLAVNFGVDLWGHWWGLSWGALGPVLVMAAGIILIMRAPRSASVAGTEAPGGTQAGERLYRSLTDRKLFGVCGGLGAYLSVDSTILRLVFVASALASLGIMILLYLAAALIIPTEKPLPRPA